MLLLLAQLDETEEDVNVRRSVYSIAMECAQNLCIHVDPVDHGYADFDATGILISIRGKANEYKIITGNYVSDDKVESLKKILDEVNCKESPEALKDFYNKILTNNNYSDKGGGGLGLIDIARKSNEKLDYSFEKVDEGYSYFKLKVRIKKKSKA